MRPEELAARLEEAGFDVVKSRSTASEITIVCPSCGDRSGNRSVSVNSLLTNCWRCNTGGPVVAWSKRVGRPVEIDAVSVTSAATADEVDQLISSLDGLGSHKRAPGFVTTVNLPRGFTSLKSKPDGAYARLIERMAVRKRLRLADFVEAGVGFTADDRKWEPFAIFPVIEWGRPVYYQGRTYVDPKDGSPTKQFPNKQECPLGSRYWVYNIDELRANGGVCVFVESILNVLSFKREAAARGIAGIVPVALFKHKISDEQLSKILQAARQAAKRGNPVTEYCFMYDSDAWDSALKDAETLRNTARVTAVRMPDGVDVNDDAAVALDRFSLRQPVNRLVSTVSLLQ